MGTLGIIGCGLLGSALADRFSAAGFAVLAYDLDPARCRGAASAAEVASACRTVVLCLPTSAVARDALHSLDLAPGSTVVDATTGEPGEMEALGATLAARGVRYLDSTVLGSSAVVRRGEALVMAGGPREAFDDCAALFAAFATRVFHLGPCGSGARMKLVVNLVLGLNRAALAEGLAFARATGVDPAPALEVLRAGAAYSRAMDAKGAKMISGDFTPEARLSQHLKDVRLILAAAEQCGAPTPLSRLHLELLERAEALGFGGADNSAILRAFEPS